MAEPSTILFFFALALGALFLVSLINQQQTRARIVAHKVVQLKRKIVELEEMAGTLETLVESAGIPKTILEESLEIINMIEQLEKSSHFCAPHRLNAEQRIEEIMSVANHKEVYRAQSSDAAIARSQYLINEAAMIIRRRQAADKLDIVEMEAFIHELAWANMMVVAITHIVEGHKCVTKGDVLKAYAFYKKAQQVLLQSSVGDEKRHRMVKQLGEIMANKRKTLSIEVMPETQHNPKKDTKDLVLPPNEVAQQMGEVMNKLDKSIKG